MTEESNGPLLVFFSALSDASRLKIVGLLAQDDFSVEELAEMLKLRPSTVSHHLSKLSKVGLVTARAESYYNVYHLNTEMLAWMAKTIMAEETLPALAADIDMDAYDNKIIQNFTRPDGSLKTIPAQRKKLEAILRYVVKEFEMSVLYAEQDVNDILARFHEDTASLRRELISQGLLIRDSRGKAYRRS